MGTVTMLRPDSMVTRALAVVVPEDDPQRDYLQEGRRRCNQLVDHPERFPELYGDVHGGRWPKRSVLELDAKIMAFMFEHHDLVDRRVGSPRSDGSVYGESLRAIARGIGVGDPDHRTMVSRTGKTRRDWPGRRRIQRRLRRLHEAKFLGGRKQMHLVLGRPSNRRYKEVPANPRFKIPAEARLAGRWVSFPTVRRVEETFIKRIHLDKRMPLEKADAKKYRAGKIGHFIDVRERRARDREIKQRQRMAAREQRIYYVEEQRLLAAKTSRRTE